MRYILSIAIYVVVVAAFMAWAAVGPYGGAISVAAFLVLAAVHPVVGLAIARWSAILLAVLLPVVGAFVPTPDGAREPIPMWFVMFVVGWPVGSALIMAGVGVGKVWAQKRLKPVG